MTNTSSIEVSLYENQIPPFVEAEMDRLYGSLYSSPAYFRIYGGAENVSTYVARNELGSVAIFLFRLEGNRIRVVNEGMDPSPEELERFANHVFKAFPSATVIVFHALATEVQNFPRACQRAVCTDNIAVALDPTVQHYLARMGSATRKNIKRHKSRLERLHPTFQFQVRIGDQIDEADVRDIIAFNRARMAIKGKASSLDEEASQRIIRLVRERGMVTMATIDGKVAGGAIVLRLGNCFCSLVNAHDARYDSHRLGTICCFLTICECIERGGKRFDLMGGHYDYKTALLGEHRYLYRFIVYRSRMHQLVNSPLAVRTALAGRLLALRMQMLAMTNGERSADAPLLAKVLNWLRSTKSALVHRKAKLPQSAQLDLSATDVVRKEERLPM